MIDNFLPLHDAESLCLYRMVLKLACVYFNIIMMMMMINTSTNFNLLQHISLLDLIDFSTSQYQVSKYFNDFKFFNACFRVKNVISMG
jgi:hypothetical protein